MSKYGRMAGILAAGALALMWALPAQAQATRTWISGVGDDVNPCSRTAPCKTFPGAISKTAAGGEIDTLDPGGFGAVTVTKAITLANEGIGEAGILVAGTNGVTVNCATDPNCTVVVRGLQLDGGPVGSNSLAGVKFVAGKTLIIQNCQIRNFTGGSPNGFGVNFVPSATQNEYLYIFDSTISTNGNGTTNGGVNIAPTGGAAVIAEINNVQVVNNTTGIKLDTTGGTGLSSLVVSNSQISGGSVEVGAIASGTQANISVVKSVVQGGSLYGLLANGSKAVISLSESTLMGNGTGVFIVPASGGAILSYGDNVINTNTTTGTFTTTIPKS